MQRVPESAVDNIKTADVCWDMLDRLDSQSQANLHGAYRAVVWQRSQSHALDCTSSALSSRRREISGRRVLTALVGFAGWLCCRLMRMVDAPLTHHCDQRVGRRSARMRPRYMILRAHVQRLIEDTGRSGKQTTMLRGIQRVGEEGTRLEDGLEAPSRKQARLGLDARNTRHDERQLALHRNLD